MMAPVGLLLIWFSATFAQSSKGPNIVFIMIDDSGWGNWGYHNNGTDGEIKTPNVDALATGGLILDRHYVHYVCSPTRSSFQSGREPVHCNTNNAEASTNLYSGVPPNYTCIATKMKEANYSTHLVGKWDAGMTVIQQTPGGRGYDSSFGYLQHANDYWREVAGACNGEPIVDLWETDKPAHGYNGTNYEEIIFAQKVYDIIKNHDSNGDQKLFLVYTPHIAHQPYECPKEHYTIYPNDENMCSSSHTMVYPGFNTSDPNAYHCRSTYQSMINLMDIIIGNITKELKDNNLWDDTLLIFTGDNGGPENNVTAANNYPLRGGKFVPFEGGIRTASFITGGYLPESRRGKIENGMMHISDWYATFCALNGIDPTDDRAKKAGLPPIDGMNVWPMLSGENATSPRTELPVDNFTLIQGNYKLITGKNVGYASWGGYFYPNSTTPMHPIDVTTLNCEKSPCLFDVVNDMTEHDNIASENSNLVQKMTSRLEELKKGYYTNNEKGSKTLCPSDIAETDCACWMAINHYNGYWGPYETIDS